MNASNARAAFLTAEWRYLVMLNYEVPAATLLPFVPRGTTLDRWNDRVLASVVGFRFLRTRVLGVPIPFHRNFDEVNLRFYVRREMPTGGVRRGVVFIRELVPRPAIALMARLAYNEPYSALPMRSRAPVKLTDTPGTVQYEWRRERSWEHVAATAVGTASVPAPGSEAQFITEHYWGYTRQRDGSTVEYEVNHPSWRVWDAHKPSLQAHVASLYGGEFAEPLATAPCSAFLAEGSPITVYRPRRLS